jgi:hypothetical protein
MATDVKLDQEDGSFLQLEARVVKAVGSDFMLDAPERHRAPNPFRRALVHDQNDGLTINFAGDYPGGVTLNGVAVIVPQQEAGDLPLPSEIPTLVVHGDISYEVGGVKLGGGTTRIPVSLGQQLGTLEIQVSELRAKVAALEALLKQ